MKKFVFIFLITLVSVTASAQMMRSRSFMKKENPTIWFVRAGMSINSLNGLDIENCSAGCKVGFDIDFGFAKPIGKSGAYWGMDLGFMNRGGKLTSEYRSEKETYNVTSWAVKYTPLTLGYKYAVTDNLKLDGHIGAFMSYDISGTDDVWDNVYDRTVLYHENSFDVGINVGVGVWYRKFNFDLSYRHGFMEYGTVPDFKDYYNTSNLRTSAFLIKVGYAF